MDNELSDKQRSEIERTLADYGFNVVFDRTTVIDIVYSPFPTVDGITLNWTSPDNFFYHFEFGDAGKESIELQRLSVHSHFQNLGARHNGYAYKTFYPPKDSIPMKKDLEKEMRTIAANIPVVDIPYPGTKTVSREDGAQLEQILLNLGFDRPQDIVHTAQDSMELSTALNRRLSMEYLDTGFFNTYYNLTASRHQSTGTWLLESYSVEFRLVQLQTEKTYLHVQYEFDDPEQIPTKLDAKKKMLNALKHKEATVQLKLYPKAKELIEHLGFDIVRDQVMYDGYLERIARFSIDYPLPKSKEGHREQIAFRLFLPLHEEGITQRDIEIHSEYQQRWRQPGREVTKILAHQKWTGKRQNMPNLDEMIRILIQPTTQRTVAFVEGDTEAQHQEIARQIAFNLEREQLQGKGFRRRSWF